MFRVSLVLLLAALAGGLRAESPSWPLPPLEGELKGDLAVPAIPGFPPLHWTTSVRRLAADQRQVTLTAEGTGASITIDAAVNLPTRIVTWTLKPTKFDLAHWNAVAAHVWPAFVDLDLTGVVVLSGSGVVQNGVPIGEVNVTLQEGTLRNVAAGWSLEHLSLEGRFGVDAGTGRVHSTAPLTFKIGTITTRRFGARNLVLNGSLQDRGNLLLTSGRVEIAGGDVSIQPAQIVLEPLRIMLDLTINRIGLQDVAALVPTAVRGASGRVDGTVQVAWSEGGGLEFTHGHIVLRPDEPAEVTLRPFPGLLTHGFPPWLMKLPRWLVRQSPFPILQQAEMGETPIAADSLDVVFSQEPDPAGRTAVVKLSGTPRGSHSRTPVHIETNVHGPLRPFIQLGTAGSGLSIDVHP